jgi:hypothetical protein
MANIESPRESAMLELRAGGCSQQPKPITTSRTTGGEPLTPIRHHSPASWRGVNLPEASRLKGGEGLGPPSHPSSPGWTGKDDNGLREGWEG